MQGKYAITHYASHTLNMVETRDKMNPFIEV